VTGLRALAALLFAAAVATAQVGPVLIDTDAGSDDFMAVALLLAQGVSIDAVTVVNGTAHVDAGARNMGRLLDLAGRPHVPVFAGRNRPLRGAAEFPAEWRKISDDLPGVPLPPTFRPPEPMHAADYLVETLRKARAPMQILALGPLTNIAEALERDRSMAGKIREIVIMGGALRVPGNLQDGGVFHTNNSTAEWNIFIDPLAARIVFRSGVPIRLISLDATNKVHIGPDFLHEFEATARSPLGRVVAGVLEADRQVIDAGIFYAWDPLAAAALLKPSIVRTASVHVEIRQDSPEAGRTVSTPGEPNAKVAMDADADAFRALFLNSFAH
jgi:pyrimidine-specific ribonucleoside hydrolase